MTDLGGGAGLGPGPPSDLSELSEHQHQRVRQGEVGYMDTNPPSSTSEMMMTNTGPLANDGSAQEPGGPSTAESVSQANGAREGTSTNNNPQTDSNTRSFAETVSRIEKFYIHLQKTEEDTNFSLKKEELSRLIHRKFGFPKEAIAGIEQKRPKVITVTTKGIDSKLYETNIAHEVKYGIITIPQKVKERKVKVTLKNIGADTEDEKVKKWLSSFGRPTEDPGIKECFKVRADETDEYLKAMAGYYNGDKSYYIFLERNIPTFGFWQDSEDADQDDGGRRIVVTYPHQPPTCGRCHKTAAQGCKGKANASRCEANHGEKIDLQEFWKIVTSQPTALPANDNEENDLRCNAVKINNVHKDAKLEDLRSLLLPAISRLIDAEDIDRTRTQGQIILRNLTAPEANSVLQHVSGKEMQGRTITACLVASLTPQKTNPAEKQGSEGDLPPPNDDKESDDDDDEPNGSEKGDKESDGDDDEPDGSKKNGNKESEREGDNESEKGSEKGDGNGVTITLGSDDSNVDVDTNLLFGEPRATSTAKSSPATHGPINLNEHANDLSLCEECFTMLVDGKCPTGLPGCTTKKTSDQEKSNSPPESPGSPSGVSIQASSSGAGTSNPPPKSPMNGYGSVEKALAEKMKNRNDEEAKRKDREIIEEYEIFKKKVADDPTWERDSLGREVERDLMGNLVKVHNDGVEEETFRLEKERLLKWREAKTRENKRNNPFKSGLPKISIPARERIIENDKETPDKYPKPGDKRGATSSPEVDSEPGQVESEKTSKGRNGKKKSKNSSANSPEKPPIREMRTRSQK